MASALSAVLALLWESWEGRSEVVVASESPEIPPGGGWRVRVPCPFGRPSDVRALTVSCALRETSGRPFSAELRRGELVLSRGVIEGRGWLNATVRPEDLAVGLALVVLNDRAKVNVTEGLAVVVDVPEVAEYAYSMYVPPLEAALSSPISVRVAAAERGGRPFDLLVLSEAELVAWLSSGEARAYFEGRGSARYEVEFEIPSGKRREPLVFLVVRRPVADIKSDRAEFVIKVPEGFGRWFYALLPPLEPVMLGALNVSGAAREASGREFTLLVLSESDFSSYGAGLGARSPYFAGTGSSSYAFSFTVPRSRASEPLYFVVESLEEEVVVAFNVSRSWVAESRQRLTVAIAGTVSYSKGVGIRVQVSATATWEERSYAHVPWALSAAAALAGLGAASLAAHRLSRQGQSF